MKGKNTMQQLILKNIDVKSLSFKTKKGKVCNHWIFLIQDNFRDELGRFTKLPKEAKFWDKEEDKQLSLPY